MHLIHNIEYLPFLKSFFYEQLMQLQAKTGPYLFFFVGLTFLTLQKILLEEKMFLVKLTLYMQYVQ